MSAGERESGLGVDQGGERGAQSSRSVPIIIDLTGDSPPDYSTAKGAAGRADRSRMSHVGDNRRSTGVETRIEIQDNDFVTPQVQRSAGNGSIRRRRAESAPDRSDELRTMCQNLVIVNANILKEVVHLAASKDLEVKQDGRSLDEHKNDLYSKLRNVGPVPLSISQSPEVIPADVSEGASGARATSHSISYGVPVTVSERVAVSDSNFCSVAINSSKGNVVALSLTADSKSRKRKHFSDVSMTGDFSSDYESLPQHSSCLSRHDNSTSSEEPPKKVAKVGGWEDSDKRQIGDVQQRVSHNQSSDTIPHRGSFSCESQSQHRQGII